MAAAPKKKTTARPAPRPPARPRVYRPGTKPQEKTLGRKVAEGAAVAATSATLSAGIALAGELGGEKLETTVQGVLLVSGLAARTFADDGSLIQKGGELAMAASSGTMAYRMTKSGVRSYMDRKEQERHAAAVKALEQRQDEKLRELQASVKKYTGTENRTAQLVQELAIDDEDATW